MSCFRPENTTASLVHAQLRLGSSSVAAAYGIYRGQESAGNELVRKERLKHMSGRSAFWPSTTNRLDDSLRWCFPSKAIKVPRPAGHKPVRRSNTPFSGSSLPRLVSADAKKTSCVTCSCSWTVRQSILSPNSLQDALSILRTRRIPALATLPPKINLKKKKGASESSQESFHQMNSQ